MLHFTAALIEPAHQESATRAAEDVENVMQVTGSHLATKVELAKQKRG